MDNEKESRDIGPYLRSQIQVSIDDLVYDRQVGWITYVEGDARLTVKVIRRKNGKLFLAHHQMFKHDKQILSIDYADGLLWKQKQRILLKRFRECVGDEYFFNFKKEGNKR